MKQSGKALQHCSEQLRNDEESWVGKQAEGRTVKVGACNEDLQIHQLLFCIQWYSIQLDMPFHGVYVAVRCGVLPKLP